MYEWRARASLVRLLLQLPGHPVDEVRALADQTLAELTRLGDAEGLASAWWVQGWLTWLECRAEETRARTRHLDRLGATRGRYPTRGPQRQPLPWRGAVRADAGRTGRRAMPRVPPPPSRPATHRRLERARPRSPAGDAGPVRGGPGARRARPGDPVRARPPLPDRCRSRGVRARRAARRRSRERRTDNPGRLRATDAGWPTQTRSPRSPRFWARRSSRSNDTTKR